MKRLAALAPSLTCSSAIRSSGYGTGRGVRGLGGESLKMRGANSRGRRVAEDGEVAGHASRWGLSTAPPTSYHRAALPGVVVAHQRVGRRMDDLRLDAWSYGPVSVVAGAWRQGDVEVRRQRLLVAAKSRMDREKSMDPVASGRSVARGRRDPAAAQR